MDGSRIRTNGKWNVEHGEHQIGQGEIGNQLIGGLHAQVALGQDDEEHQQVAEQRNNDDQRVRQDGQEVAYYQVVVVRVVAHGVEHAQVLLQQLLVTLARYIGHGSVERFDGQVVGVEKGLE